MGHLYIFVVLLASSLSIINAVELTFELPDNEKQCFFESIEKGTKSTIEFQVITGGHYDVDMELTAPSGQILYKDVKKQYDSFTWTADLTGIFKFCFSNEFSTFSHKVVYFDLEVGDEKPLVEGMTSHDTAMTLMESGSENIHNGLSFIFKQQMYFRNRESAGRVFAESLNKGVMYWSLAASCLILILGVGQVMVLRSFFSDKKSTVPVHS
ncbi:transmembrane emp24 domain-containing protein 7 isoform X1 [Patella vulgata]|uniref:transmembrane emp24 domain-containing protein 7 isoform X1 n=1 Tax=Patella vulgata TaxID=6465 RepID=UPI0021805E35|nr:transmembrane emp24 domain-containing protein 7 isoform X1 [Patella vulgata]